MRKVFIVPIISILCISLSACTSADKLTREEWEALSSKSTTTIYGLTTATQIQNKNNTDIITSKKTESTAKNTQPIEKKSTTLKKSTVPPVTSTPKTTATSAKPKPMKSAYDKLVEWLIKNGKVNGERVEIKYYPDETTQLKIAYDATDNYAFVSYQLFDSSALFYLLDLKPIELNNNCYCSVGEGANMREVYGRINPSTFTSQTPITITKYDGAALDRNDFAEMLRLGTCESIEFLSWFLETYDVGLSISDLGFSVY